MRWWQEPRQLHRAVEFPCPVSPCRSGPHRPPDPLFFLEGKVCGDRVAAHPTTHCLPGRNWFNPTWFVPLPAGSASQVQSLSEDGAELCIENGVDDRVESAVDVAQPSDSADQARGHGAGGTQRSCYVHHEERRPAYQEGP